MALHSRADVMPNPFMIRPIQQFKTKILHTYTVSKPHINLFGIPHYKRWNEEMISIHYKYLYPHSESNQL